MWNGRGSGGVERPLDGQEGSTGRLRDDEVMLWRPGSDVIREGDGDGEGDATGTEVSKFR